MSAKKSKTQASDKYELLVVIGTRKLYRALVPRLVHAARLLASALKKVFRPRHLAALLRELIAFVRRQGVIFYAFAALWAWALLQTITFIREVHPAKFIYNHDNLISSGRTASFSFAADLGQLAIAFGFGVLMVLAVMAARKPHWRRVIASVNLVVLAAGAMFFQASTLYNYDSINAEMSTTAPPSSLAQTIVQRAECGDAVRMVDNYNYATKTFYDLRDQGYHLAATFTSDTSNLDSGKACSTYLSIRAHYPSDRIVVQLFTRADDGTLQPYTYTQTNMEEQRGINGIFVKD